MTIELTTEQVDLVVLGLRTAAVMSRHHGHKDQADSFSYLAEQIRLQAQKHENDGNN